MSLCIRSGRRSLRSSIISFGMDAAFLLYSDGDVRGGDKVLYRVLDAHGLSGRTGKKKLSIRDQAAIDRCRELRTVASDEQRRYCGQVELAFKHAPRSPHMVSFTRCAPELF